MKREVKFRVWVAAYEEMCYDAGITQHPDTKTPEYFYLLPNGETRGRFATGDWECPDHVWEQFTGLKDSQGKDIYEGDILLGSEARFERELIEDNIYVVDTAKPLPAPDVPFFRAVVEWNQSMCGFKLTYLWRRPDWGDAASGDLTDTGYIYTIIGNRHENEELMRA